MIVGIAFFCIWTHMCDCAGFAAGANPVDMGAASSLAPPCAARPGKASPPQTSAAAAAAVAAKTAE